MDKYADGLALFFEQDTKTILKEVAKVQWDKTGKKFKDSLKDTLFDKDGDPWEKAGEKFGGYLQSIGSAFLKGVEKLIGDALEEMDNMLNYSLLTDSSVRDLKFSYGFSDAQAYGFDKALGALGISEEDLMYMNPQQSQMFRDAFTKYTEKYSQLSDSGFFEKMLEYNVEMNEFKEDLKLQVVEFFMNNKETIKTALNVGMKFMDIGIKAFGWIIKYFSGGTEGIGQADVSGVLTNYSTKNTSVSVNNTFNGIQQKDRPWLQNAGQMTYEQMIQALEG